MTTLTTSQFLKAVEDDKTPEITIPHMSLDEIEANKGKKYSGVDVGKAASYHTVFANGKKFHLIATGNIKTSDLKNTHLDGMEEYRAKKQDDVSKFEFMVSMVPEKHGDDKGATDYITITEAVSETLEEQIKDAAANKKNNTNNTNISGIITSVYGPKTNEKDEAGKSMRGKPLKGGAFATHTMIVLDKHGHNPKKFPTVKIFDYNTATVDDKGNAHFEELKVGDEYVNSSNIKSVFNYRTIVKYIKVEYEVNQSPYGTSNNIKVSEIAIIPGNASGDRGVNLGDDMTKEIREKMEKVNINNNNNNNNVKIIEGSVEKGTKPDEFMTM